MPENKNYQKKKKQKKNKKKTRNYHKTRNIGTIHILYQWGFPKGNPFIQQLMQPDKNAKEKLKNLGLGILPGGGGG